MFVSTKSWTALEVGGYVDRVKGTTTPHLVTHVRNGTIFDRPMNRQELAEWKRGYRAARNDERAGRDPLWT